MRVDPYAKSIQRPSPAMRAFALVLLLHVGLLVLLHSVMQTTMPAKFAEVISAHIIQEFSVPELANPTPPAPVSPKTQTLPLAQTAPPLPSTAPIPPAQAPSAAPAMTVAPAAVAPAAATPVAPVKSSIVIPPARVESSCASPRYPAASERLREEGVVTLRFLISENGQVVRGQVDKSSGYKRLDDAALAALSLCKFKAATVDGKPQQDWSALRYRWELKDD